MVAVWCVHMWENMNKPTEFNLIELGPGNGTLMKDILNLSRNRFSEFAAAASVRLIEVSDEMRKIQSNTLDCMIEEEEKEAKEGEEEVGRAEEINTRLENDGVSDKQLKKESSVDVGDNSVKQGYFQKSKNKLKDSMSHISTNRSMYNNSKSSSSNKSTTDKNTPASTSTTNISAITKDGITITWYKHLYEIYQTDNNNNGDTEDDVINQINFIKDSMSNINNSKSSSSSSSSSAADRNSNSNSLVSYTQNKHGIERTNIGK